MYVYDVRAIACVCARTRTRPLGPNIRMLLLLLVKSRAVECAEKAFNRPSVCNHWIPIGPVIWSVAFLPHSHTRYLSRIKKASRFKLLFSVGALDCEYESAVHTKSMRVSGGVWTERCRK